jgi:hypothetical protein
LITVVFSVSFPSAKVDEEEEAAAAAEDEGEEEGGVLREVAGPMM